MGYIAAFRQALCIVIILSLLCTVFSIKFIGLLWVSLGVYSCLLVLIASLNWVADRITERSY